MPLVLAEIPRGLVDDVICVDNGCTDRSPELARAAGARVVSEPRRGYGNACLAGIAALHPDTEVVVFLDADYSDYPEDLVSVAAPVMEGRADMVVGSRMKAKESRMALLPQARFGNRLAAWFLRVLFGVRCSDLGPMRALRRSALDHLGMRDRTYGWTVEMQIRARLAGLRVEEVPVRYRARIGESKITGTLRGTLGASRKILGTLFGYRLRPPAVARYVPAAGAEEAQ